MELPELKRVSKSIEKKSKEKTILTMGFLKIQKIPKKQSVKAIKL